jgi:molybdopterin-containing oxidoreductase family iron-sulfur binding subunit
LWPSDSRSDPAQAKPLAGKQQWRSLEELSRLDELQENPQREFGERAGELDAVGRRTFLKLMGASLALAGASGCKTQPAGKIVPYVKAPEQIVPGKPLFYATALTLGGFAKGVLVESNMGRPTKIEGNPSHPANLGALDAMSQAAILSLYDPDRSQNTIEQGNVSTWGQFATAAARMMAAQRNSGGAGVRILTETVTSPTLSALLEKFLQEFPNAKWHRYEPINSDNELEGAKLALGEPLSCVYNFENADVIVSLDADFLGPGPGSVRYWHDFAARRRVRDGKNLNRLYCIESALTLTGANADHRQAVRSSQMEDVIRELAGQVGVANVAQIQSGTPPIPAKWMAALIHDLQQHQGRSLIIAGNSQPAEVHALAHAMNDALGNTDKTVSYIAPVEARAGNQLQSLREFIADADAGQVEVAIILGGNPAYTAPVDLDFTSAFLKSKLRIHLGLYENETSTLCHWHIPQAHELECWGDARAYDGTATIQQPLILPLYNGQSPLELLSVLFGHPDRTSYELVREYWQDKLGSDFESAWRSALHEGLVKDSAFPKKRVDFKTEPIAIHDPPVTGLEINFQPDPTIYDGRFVNNGWLQELPRPLSTLTWENAVFIAPATAQRLNLRNEDVVELKLDGRSVSGPVCILPGHAADALTLHLGYGQRNTGRIGNGIGFNAYSIRTSNNPSFAGGVTLEKTGRRHALALTQEHFSMHGRELVRTATSAEFAANPAFARTADQQAPRESLYPQIQYKQHAWGMVIDTGACIGCGACMLACQSENNIPIVGKSEVANSREMHWIRVDRYFSGAMSEPNVHFEPVPCMHCENAPCEPVCPVAATVHGSEGLNEMVYNRCIGTRYCSNNCPYKVRRFNFFQYSDLQNPDSRLRYNPEVTVRERGVMEKCTYCVQRINRVRIEAEKENRSIGDGQIIPACQQTCPAEAIVFGDINDPASRVAKLKASPLNYSLLEELNTRPRTTYLAKVRNPNPTIERLGGS